MSLWSRYFKVGPPAQPTDVSPHLWNDADTVRAYYTHDDSYQAAILEQYKLYVELTDRISARRGLANTFFLTLHGAILTVIGVFWKDRPDGFSAWFLLPILVLAL